MGTGKRLLLIDTCGTDGLVGLGDGDAIVVQRELGGRTASARIAGAVRELLTERGWAAAELDGVGVVSGPGSFTGLRTGLAFAKGFCVATGVPLAAVSRLMVLAEAAGVERGWAVLGAGRDGYYVRTGLWDEGAEHGGARDDGARNGAARNEGVRDGGVRDGGAREWMSGREELLRIAGTAAGAGIAVAEARVAEELRELKPRLHAIALADMLPAVRAGLLQGGTDVASSDANYVRDENSIYGRGQMKAAVGGSAG